MDQRASEATNFYPSAGQIYILGGLGGRDKKKYWLVGTCPKVTRTNRPLWMIGCHWRDTIFREHSEFQTDRDVNVCAAGNN